MKATPNLVIALFFLGVTIIVYRPFLLSPAFALVDDGYSLMRGNQLLNADSLSSFRDALVETSIGRFRPMYLLYFSVINVFFGTNPVGLWLGQACVFWLTLVLLSRLINLSTNNKLLAVIGPLIWMVMPTVWTNSLRLGTAEPRQALFILSAILLTLQKKKSRMDLALVAVCTIAAIGTKETSVMLFPFFALYALLTYQKNSRITTVSLWVLSGMAAVVAVGFYLLRPVLASGYAASNFGGSYSDFYLRLLQSTTTYIRYYLPAWAVGMSLAIRCIIEVWKKRHNLLKHFSIPASILALLAQSIIFVLLWKYQFDRYFYLPWLFTLLLLMQEIGHWHGLIKSKELPRLLRPDRVFMLMILLIISTGFAYQTLFHKHGMSLKAILVESVTTYKQSFDSIQISNTVISNLLARDDLARVYTTSDNYEVIYELGLYGSQLGTSPISVVGRSKELAKDQPGFTYSESIVNDYLNDHTKRVLVGTLADLSLVESAFTQLDLKPTILEPVQRYDSYDNTQYWWILERND